MNKQKAHVILSKSTFYGVYIEAIYSHSKHSFFWYMKSGDIAMKSTYI